MRAKRASVSSSTGAVVDTPVPVPVPVQVQLPAPSSKENDTVATGTHESSKLAELRAKRDAAVAAASKPTLASPTLSSSSTPSVPVVVPVPVPVPTPASILPSQMESVPSKVSPEKFPSATVSASQVEREDVIDHIAVSTAVAAAASGLQREVAQLRDQIEELNMTIEALTLDKEQLAIELEMAQEERLSASKSQGLSAAANLLNSATEESLRTENGRLREALTVLQALHNEQTQEQQHIKLSATELQARANRTQDLEEEVESLRSRLLEFTESMDSSGLEDMVETLSLKNEEYLTQLRHLQLSVADLETAQELDAEIEAAQRQEIEALKLSETNLLQTLRKAEDLNAHNTAELSEALEKYRNACELQRTEIDDLRLRLRSQDPLIDVSGDTVNSASLSQLLLAPFKSICWNAALQPVSPQCQFLIVRLTQIQQRLAESSRELELLRASIPLQAIPTLSSQVLLGRIETRNERMCTTASMLFRAFTSELSIDVRKIDKRAHRDYLRLIWHATSALIDAQTCLLKVFFTSVFENVGLPMSVASESRVLLSTAESLKALEECFTSSLASMERCARSDLLWPETATSEELEVFSKACQTFSESVRMVLEENLLSFLEKKITNELHMRLSILDNLRDANHAHCTCLIILRILSFASFQSEEQKAPEDETTKEFVKTMLQIISTSRQFIDEQSIQLVQKEILSLSSEGKYFLLSYLLDEDFIVHQI
jgi:hypothetical protein